MNPISFKTVLIPQITLDALLDDIETLRRRVQHLVGHDAADVDIPRPYGTMPMDMGHPGLGPSSPDPFRVSPAETAARMGPSMPRYNSSPPAWWGPQSGSRVAYRYTASSAGSSSISGPHRTPNVTRAVPPRRRRKGRRGTKKKGKKARVVESENEDEEEEMESSGSGSEQGGNGDGEGGGNGHGHESGGGGRRARYISA